MSDVLYFFVGFGTGLLGTLIGAGGGFLLAPLFLFLFPELPPARLTALSLLAVAANSVSGSLGYLARGQVHVPSTLLFTAAALPGVWIGVQLTHVFSRHTYELIFAALLFCLGIFVLARSFGNRGAVASPHFWTRRNQWLGSLVSFFVGMIASLLGIGGGIIHVPLLSEGLGYPVHLAAGTSHAILALTALAAVAEHYFRGDLTPLMSFVPYLVIGLILGAQLGAAVAKKVPRKWILRCLGMALLSVALRLAIHN